MEKKNIDSVEKEEKRAMISSSGDLMEFEEHISITGSAKISGGKVKKTIRISGSGVINGDLECDGLTSSGTLKGSGNLTAHGDISSSGSLNIAGFLKAGHFVTVDEGIEFSGSSNINGNLSAQKSIKIDGSTKIEGNVVAENVLMGASEGVRKKQHYRIHGSILAKNIVDVNRTHVEGDIKGKDVTIGRGSEILGTVYYVDKIEIDKKAKLANEPTQINLDEL
ncbi:hypothetical protein ES703_122642 [subsurface metagenome]